MVSKAELSDCRQRYEAASNRPLPPVDSHIILFNVRYTLRGIDPEGNVVLHEKGSRYRQFPLEQLIRALSGTQIKWGREFRLIGDPLFAARIHDEICSLDHQRGYPPIVPSLPEHRFSLVCPEDGRFCYTRPKMNWLPATDELVQRAFGVTSPLVIAFSDYSLRKERFVVTQFIPSWKYDRIELMFDGYRLHSNGMIQGPVMNHHLPGEVSRRTLTGDWVDIAFLEPEE